MSNFREIGRQVEKGGDAAGGGVGERPRVTSMRRQAARLVAGESGARRHALARSTRRPRARAGSSGLKLSAPDELNELMTDQQYKEFLATLE